jgi:hypothetical protein
MFYSKSICLFSSGGIVLASRDGKIVFESTLDARLEVVFRKKLPEVPLAISFSQYTMSHQTLLSSHHVQLPFFLKEKPINLQLYTSSRLCKHSEWQKLHYGCKNSTPFFICLHENILAWPF